jgi:hypothetical protein
LSECAFYSAKNRGGVEVKLEHKSEGEWKEDLFAYIESANNRHDGEDKDP